MLLNQLIPLAIACTLLIALPAQAVDLADVRVKEVRPDNIAGGGVVIQLDIASGSVSASQSPCDLPTGNAAATDNYYFVPATNPMLQHLYVAALAAVTSGETVNVYGDGSCIDVGGVTYEGVRFVGVTK